MATKATTMTHTSPRATSSETRGTAGQAGKAGSPREPGVDTSSLPPLKTPRNHRLSRETLNALELLKTRWNCSETMAVELAIARAAAYEMANMADDTSGVSTPPRSSER